ncbi:DNA repair protein RecO [Clostridium botulinum]|uniref:DNA repair protein RecO n=1 Tax=Clostridium botulinum TaxID=1491 RepID=UPI000518F7E1|nr:DNA repair protein RecO [Clostridium botulinum]MBY6881252.1 DNA repair protein RecO [Clostridium botulinum]NEZ87036.1 DNA repair protein RecO [Clostridium botulinum]NFB00107.1 DNA repair protein RecO [Clostridium botulinum]NFE30688.1 DNA repair protein RecO [Clostridium botulinum]WCJ75151.1 DNA repair protein RecO [Clostridium botulinum]
MSLYKTRAVVIKTQEFKEADKLVWLYTEKLGKITAIAKGAKKNRSKYLSNTSPFCYGEYVLYKGKSLFNLSEAQLIDSFQDFLRDLDTLTYGSYFCELIDICTEEKESSRELFQELVKSLFLMKNKVVDIEILARAFEMKVLKYTGYALNFNHCVECGREIETSNYISLQSLGGICNYCNKINGIGVTYATYNILKYIYEAPLEKLYKLSIDTETKKDIYKILNTIINQNYLKKPKSLQILNYIKEE